MANSATFGANNAITSPFFIPLLLRAEATFLLKSLTWENVYLRFVELQIYKQTRNIFTKTWKRVKKCGGLMVKIQMFSLHSNLELSDFWL